MTPPLLVRLYRPTTAVRALQARVAHDAEETGHTSHGSAMGVLPGSLLHQVP